MRTRWTRRIIGAAVLSAAVLTTAFAADPTVPPATAEKAIAADTAHLMKVFELAKTKKKMDGRVKATATLIAAYAQDGNKPGVRDQALKVAAAAAKKDLAGAEEAAKGIAAATGGDAKPVDLSKQNKIDLHEVMDLFGGSVGGGMNIEKDIREAKKNGVTDVAAAEIIGARTAVIADLTFKLTPEFGGKKTAADWEKWTKQMKTTSTEIVAVAGKGATADKAALKKLMSALDATCTNCHNTFRDD